MKYRFPLAAALVLGMAGCAGFDRVGPEVPLSPAAQHAVAQAAANQMKNPNSAEFRNWHAFESQNGLLVCGEINAKNSFGGYVGLPILLPMHRLTDVCLCRSHYRLRPAADQMSWSMAFGGNTIRAVIKSGRNRIFVLKCKNEWRALSSVSLQRWLIRYEISPENARTYHVPR